MDPTHSTLSNSVNPWMTTSLQYRAQPRLVLLLKQRVRRKGEPLHSAIKVEVLKLWQTNQGSQLGAESLPLLTPVSCLQTTLGAPPKSARDAADLAFQQIIAIQWPESLLWQSYQLGRSANQGLPFNRYFSYSTDVMTDRIVCG